MTNKQPLTNAASVAGVILVALPLVIMPDAGRPGYYLKLFVLLSGLVVLAAIAFRRGAQPLFHPWFLPAAAFLIVNALSITQSVNRVASVVVLSHRFSLLAAIFLIATLIQKSQMNRLIALLGATSSVTALIGIAQYAGWFGLDIPSAGMPSSTFGYRNFAAAFTIAAIPFVAAEVVRKGRSRAGLVWSTVLFLNGAFLITTRTRAAWGACALSAVIGVSLYLWKRRSADVVSTDKHLEPLAMLFGAVLLAVSFSVIVPPAKYGNGFVNQFSEKTTVIGTIGSVFAPGADKDRYIIWQHTIDMITTSPVLGVGVGNWQYVYPSFDQGDVIWRGATPIRPHNDYLWIASETGAIGLLLFVCVIVLTTLTGIRSLRDIRENLAFYQVLAACASLTAIAFHSLFSFPLERIPVTFIAALSIAILIKYDTWSQPVHLSSPLQSTVWGGLAFVLISGGAISWRAFESDRLAYRQSLAVARQDWVGGERLGTEALAKGVFDPQVLLLRGLSRHMMGQFDSAIGDQRKCLDYHPHFVNAVNNLGMSLNAAGHFDEAIEVLDRINTLDPDHIEGHLNRARAYIGKSRPDAAAREFEIAIEKAPKRQDILFEAVKFHERSGISHNATALLEAGLLRIPGQFSLHYRLGVISQKQGNLEAAAKHFEKVLVLNRSYVPVRYNLGELHLALGDTLRAVREYESFIRNWTGPKQATVAVGNKLRSLR